MDYIDGEDLRQRIERLKILPEQEVLLIGVAICDALMHLHSRVPAIIHGISNPQYLKSPRRGISPW